MPPSPDPADELARARAASAARLRQHSQAIGRDLAALADPRTIARHHPWLAVGGAALAGWVVVAHLRGRRSQPPPPQPATAESARPKAQAWPTRLISILRTALLFYRSWARDFAAGAAADPSDHRPPSADPSAAAPGMDAPVRAGGDPRSAFATNGTPGSSAGMHPGV